MLSSSIMQPFASVPPCVDTNGHNYQANYPPPHVFGYMQIVCTRCGHRKAVRDDG